MNKEDFRREFQTLCTAYGKSMENEEFLGRAYWFKFRDLKAEEFFELIMRAIDRCQWFPSVHELVEMAEYKKSLEPEKKIEVPFNTNRTHRQKCIDEMRMALTEGRKRAIEYDEKKRESLRRKEASNG